MMNIPEDIDQFLEYQTDELKSIEFRECNFRFKILEAVIKSIFKDSLQLNFVSQILQSNNENSFAVNETTYTLHRMSYEGPSLEILYEVQDGSEDGQIVLEAISISKGLRFTIEKEHISDAESLPMLHVQFKGSEFNHDKSQVLKHFVLLAVRAICENLEFFKLPQNIPSIPRNQNSVVLEVLVPQKWWNANEMDNIGWKQKALSTINHLIKKAKLSELNEEDKESLSMVQMVPNSIEILFQYLNKNAEYLNESNISFVISSSNRINIFLKKE